MSVFIANLGSNISQIPNLSKKERIDLLTKLGKETHAETVKALNTLGKVLVVRPTGWGKTRLLVNLAKEYTRNKPNKRILYAYPLNIIKTEIYRNKKYMSDGIIKSNVDFVSYQELTMKFNKEGKNYWREVIADKYSLVILDEAHRAGADGFLSIYETIKDLIGVDNIHLVGATATPNRMSDTEDDNITTVIFENSEISTLTLEDAIALGIMKPPLYGKSLYNTDELIKLLQSKMKKVKTLDNSGIQMLLSRYLQDVVGAEEFIINSLEQADYNLRKQTYFKFIVFFNDIADVEERGPIVERWFKDAFNVILKNRYNLRSVYNVRTHFVTSSDPSGQLRKLAEEEEERRNYFNNTKHLDSIGRENRTIDLIMTVNMINMGYHIEDITGIIMLRGTKSEIIYYQQMGRCLSVLNDSRPIVLDFVQNYTEIYDKRFKNVLKGVSNNSPMVGGIGGSNSGLDRDLVLEYSNIQNIDTVIKLAQEKDIEGVDKIIWMYTEKKAPLCVICSELGVSLYAVRKILRKYGIQLRSEDSMYDYIKKYQHNITGLNHILPFIYSERVKRELKGSKKINRSIFRLYNEL